MKRPSSTLSATAQHRDDGIDLACLAADRDARDDLPDVGLGFEVVAPVAAYGHTANKVPRQELFERVRHVGARNGKRFGNTLGRHGRAGEIKQRVDLRDRSIDAPYPAHVAPFENEVLDGWR